MKNHPWTMSDTQIIWRLLDDPDIRGLKVSAPDLFPERTAASVYAKLRYERLARELAMRAAVSMLYGGQGE